MNCRTAIAAATSCRLLFSFPGYGVSTKDFGGRPGMPPAAALANPFMRSSGYGFN
jgi:hypothetical protein